MSKDWNDWTPISPSIYTWVHLMANNNLKTSMVMVSLVQLAYHQHVCQNLPHVLQTVGEGQHNHDLPRPGFKLSHSSIPVFSWSAAENYHSCPTLFTRWWIQVWSPASRSNLISSQISIVRLYYCNGAFGHWLIVSHVIHKYSHWIWWVFPHSHTTWPKTGQEELQMVQTIDWSIANEWL